MNFLDIDFSSTRSHLIAKHGVTDFGDKGMAWCSNFQGWRSWKWRLMSISEEWGMSLDYFSWTYRRHYDELVAPKTEVKVWWTIGVNELSRWLPNPNSHGHGVKEVSCSREVHPITYLILLKILISLHFHDRHPWKLLHQVIPLSPKSVTPCSAIRWLPVDEKSISRKFT